MILAVSAIFGAMLGGCSPAAEGNNGTDTTVKGEAPKEGAPMTPTVDGANTPAPEAKK